MTAVQILGLVLIAWAIGVFIGHAFGYARAKDVERRRRVAALNGGPRYARASSDVGSPE